MLRNFVLKCQVRVSAWRLPIFF